MTRCRKIGGFLQRVGAVRDDDAVDVVALHERRHAAAQLDQVLVGEALGCDLKDLLAAHVGGVLQLRNPGEELVHRDLGRLIGRAGSGRGAGPGDRAAGGQNHDVGKVGRGRRDRGQLCVRRTGQENAAKGCNEPKRALVAIHDASCWVKGLAWNGTKSRRSCLARLASTFTQTLVNDLQRAMRRWTFGGCDAAIVALRGFDVASGCAGARS